MRIGFLAALVMLMVLPANAQERRTATDADVLTQGTTPAPGYPFVIIVSWGGSSSQIHFKNPFKAVRVGDTFVAAAEPRTDHIIDFTGRSPGETSLVLESTDPKIPNWVGTIKVVRQVREVKIYTPKSGDKKSEGGGGSVTVVNSNSSAAPTTKESDQAEYRSILCNEISCRPVPRPDAP